MENCLGVILNENLDENFSTLCEHRPSYMLPYAGRYRILDFALSGMVNHKINNIVLYTGEKMRSAMDHIGSGKSWELNKRFSGLKLFSPRYSVDAITRKNQVAQLFNTLTFYEEAKEDYIFLMRPNILAKVDLDAAFREFIAADADISLIYKKEVNVKGKCINCDKLHFTEDGRFREIGINLGIDENFNHFIGMGFIKKDVFIDLIRALAERKIAPSIKEAISNYRDHFNIVTYEYEGKLERIKDIESFFKSNMNLLEEDNYLDLFFNNGTILTKSKDEPPTSFTESSNVTNSMIANGCKIEGTVENSVIFRGVTIGKGAVVRNSIIMKKSVIGKNAHVENAIFDKASSIGAGLRVSGSSKTPYILAKNGKVKG